MQINIEKKHLIIFSIFLAILFSAYTMAQWDATRPWHPLVQISGDQGTTSVDADDDGIIDNSSSCSGDGVCEANIFSGNGSGVTDIAWNELTGVPAGFADNVDNTGGTLDCISITFPGTTTGDALCAANGGRECTAVSDGGASGAHCGQSRPVGWWAECCIIT